MIVRKQQQVRKTTKDFVAKFAAVTFLSLGVWMNHMFTMGVNYSVLQVFSIPILAISIPFEGLVLDLVLTLYKSRIKLTAPMLWCLAAVLTLILGVVISVLQVLQVGQQRRAR